MHSLNPRLITNMRPLRPVKPYRYRLQAVAAQARLLDALIRAWRKGRSMEISCENAATAFRRLADRSAQVSAPVQIASISAARWWINESVRRQYQPGSSPRPFGAGPRRG